jgi:hypothetical protein
VIYQPPFRKSRSPRATDRSYSEDKSLSAFRPAFPGDHRVLASRTFSLWRAFNRFLIAVVPFILCCICIAIVFLYALHVKRDLRVELLRS